MSNKSKYPSSLYSDLEKRASVSNGALGLKAVDDIVLKIKRASSMGKLDVASAVGVNGSIIKFDVVTFRDEGVLVVEDMNAEFIAVAIERLVLDFRNPGHKAFISRPMGSEEFSLVKNLKGDDGLDGLDGPDGVGETQRRGNDGKPGEPGSDGFAGRTFKLPPLYIFIQDIEFGSAIQPGRQYLSIVYEGVPGGEGGSGGKGGQGGRGAPGKEGATSLYQCTDGAGDGGRGGDAGQGGQGGAGGRGGNGGDVFLFGPDLKKFDFVNAFLEGAEPGPPGKGGNPKNPGRGGAGGRRNPPWCDPGGTGPSGGYANPPTRGDGARGLPGTRGRQVLTQRVNTDLF